MTKYNHDGSRASESTKKFVNDSGLSHAFSLITSFVRNYASPKTHNHDSVYSKLSHKHSASDITSGTLPIGKGGTGGSSTKSAQYNLMNDILEGTVNASDTDVFVMKHHTPTATDGALLTRTSAQVWAWIKSKCDGLYQAKGSYADASHSHSWSSITGKPTIPSALTHMPVGYVYISYSSTSPASLFGGSWAAITGRFPYFNAGTSTGGSNSHTLSINELPKHVHGVPFYSTDNEARGYALTVCNGGFQNRVAVTSAYMKYKDSYTGNNYAHNNMPSYQTLYAWRRTS